MINQNNQILLTVHKIYFETNLSPIHNNCQIKFSQKSTFTLYVLECFKVNGLQNVKDIMGIGNKSMGKFQSFGFEF